MSWCLAAERQGILAAPPNRHLRFHTGISKAASALETAYSFVVPIRSSTGRPLVAADDPTAQT